MTKDFLKSDEFATRVANKKTVSIKIIKTPIIIGIDFGGKKFT